MTDDDITGPDVTGHLLAHPGTLVLTYYDGSWRTEPMLAWAQVGDALVPMVSLPDPFHLYPAYEISDVNSEIVAVLVPSGGDSLDFIPGPQFYKLQRENPSSLRLKLSGLGVPSARLPQPLKETTDGTA